MFYPVPVLIVLNWYPFFVADEFTQTWGRNLWWSFLNLQHSWVEECWHILWVSLLSIFAIPKGGESKSVWRSPVRMGCLSCLMAQQIGKILTLNPWSFDLLGYPDPRVVPLRTGRNTLKEVGLKEDDLLHVPWKKRWKIKKSWWEVQRKRIIPIINILKQPASRWDCLESQLLIQISTRPCILIIHLPLVLFFS